MTWEEAFHILEPIPTDDYIAGAWNDIRYYKVKAVFELAQEVPPGSCIVELGTWRGLTAAALALGADPSVIVYTLDDYNTRRVEHVSDQGLKYDLTDYDIFQENMKKLPLDVAKRIVQLQVEAREAADTWQKPVGLLFWDMWGDRLYDDISAWSKRIAPGGRIAVKVFEDGRLNEGTLTRIENLVQEKFHPAGLILVMRKSAPTQEHVFWIVDGETYLSEAKRSAESVMRHMPYVKADICMPQERKHDDWFTESTRILCDILRDMPLGEKVLLLDSDTYMLEGAPELFQMLDRFEFVYAHAPGHQTAPAEGPIPDCFPEPQIGVIAMRNTENVQKLWAETYELQKNGRGTDQAALREALWYQGVRDQVSMAVIPCEYDFRFAFGGQLRDRVKILHGHAPDAHTYEEIGRAANTGYVAGYQLPPRLWVQHVP